MAKILLAICLLLSSSLSQAVVFHDAGFTVETVARLTPFSILDMAFAPDGRIFLLQKNGIIRILKNGAILPTPFLDISSKVNIVNDRGSLGIALDPTFSSNGYVYIGYVYESGGNPTDQGPKTSRVSRFTADPGNPDIALPNSEFILIGRLSNTPCAKGTDCMPVYSDSHSVGTLRFGPDGTLYISNGDGSRYDQTDSNALAAQDLDSLAGKILRIHRDGNAPIDNPFYNGSNSVQSKVWAFGLRNPFRFAMDPAVEEPFIGDVGWEHWEELNRGRGLNFGWPCFEGNNPQPNYQSFTQCQQLSPNSVTRPFFTYDRSQGSTAIGGAFYTGDEYPAQYTGNLFFADYSHDSIRRVVFDSLHNLDRVVDFADQAGNVVDIELGPDGFLYYISLTTGELRRIRFNGPFASASADPMFGYSRLRVNFSSAASFDPQNLPLTFLWDFGDGDTANAPNPGHRYKSSTVQTFNVVLKVTNSQNQSSSDTLKITVGSLPPVPTILSPADGTSVQPGDTLSFQGSGTDPDDGSLPSNALNWTVLLHHNDHVHSFLTTTGTGGNFIVNDHGPGTYSYEFILTATDSSGLTQTDIHHVKIETPCIFCRDFENGALPTDWTFTNDWSVTAGDLIANATTKKAKAIAAPAFAGCSNCFIETEMTSSGGEGNRLSLLGWYEDSGANVELMMKEENDRWILKQRWGGTTKKSRAVLEIEPNVKYAIRLAFDGNTFQVYVGEQIIITMPKIPGSSPFGTVGFQVKKTTGAFEEIGVH